MDIESVFTSLRKDEPQKKPVEGNAASLPKVVENELNKKEVGKLSPNDDTPVGIDLDEVRKAIAGITRGTDTASDSSQTSEITHNLHGHLSALSYHLFESYYRLLNKLYHELKVDAEKMFSCLERREEKILELKNRILQCEVVITRTGWSSVLLVFRKWAAKKKKPDFMIELDRLDEPGLCKDLEKLKGLEEACDRLQGKSDIWNGYIHQAERQMLSFGKIDELVKILRSEKEDDVPMAAYQAFLREQGDLMNTIEKITKFMELKAKEAAGQPAVIAAQSIENAKSEQPDPVNSNHSAPDEKKEHKDEVIPVGIPLPAENIRIVKPDYSKVAACLVTQEAPAPEQKAVSAHDKTVVDFMSPIHSDAVKTDSTKAPESKNEA